MSARSRRSPRSIVLAVLAGLLVGVAVGWATEPWIGAGLGAVVLLGSILPRRRDRKKKGESADQSGSSRA